jgi:hypothetical protein
VAGQSGWSAAWELLNPDGRGGAGFGPEQEKAKVLVLPWPTGEEKSAMAQEEATTKERGRWGRKEEGVKV